MTRVYTSIGVWTSQTTWSRRVTRNPKNCKHIFKASGRHPWDLQLNFPDELVFKFLRFSTQSTPRSLSPPHHDRGKTTKHRPATAHPPTEHRKGLRCPVATGKALCSPHVPVRHGYSHLQRTTDQRLIITKCGLARDENNPAAGFPGINWHLRFHYGASCLLCGGLESSQGRRGDHVDRAYGLP